MGPKAKRGECVKRLPGSSLQPALNSHPISSWLAGADLFRHRLASWSVNRLVAVRPLTPWLTPSRVVQGLQQSLSASSHGGGFDYRESVSTFFDDML